MYKKLMVLFGAVVLSITLVACGAQKYVGVELDHTDFYPNSKTNSGHITGKTKPGATIKLIDPTINKKGDGTSMAKDTADKNGKFSLYFHNESDNNYKYKVVVSKKGFKNTTASVRAMASKGDDDDESISSSSSTHYNPNDVSWSDNSWQGVNILIDSIATSEHSVQVHYLILNGDHNISLNLDTSNIKLPDGSTGSSTDVLDSEDTLIVANDTTTNTVTYDLPDGVTAGDLTSLEVQFSAAIINGESHSYQTGQIAF